MGEIRMSGVRFLPVLMAVALACIVAAITLLLLPGTGRGPAVQDADELALLALKIPAQAQAALYGNTEGNKAAFQTLAQSRTRFAARADALGADVAQFDASKALLESSQTVLDVEEILTGVRKASAEVRALVPQLLQSLGNVASALGSPGVEGMARHLERFELAGLRLQQDTEALAGGIGDGAAIARRLADGNDYMGQVIGGLAGEDAGLGLPSVTGTEASTRFKSTQALYAQLSEKVRGVISAADRLREARAAGIVLAVSGDQVHARFGSGSSADDIAGRTAAAARGKTLPVALLGGGVLALLVLSLLYAMSGSIRKTVELQTAKNERNQEAILRLLDELSSLADGDLTVQATVTEDITGAIADSINYAIEALRELVTTITESAVSLDAAAKQTQASAGQLAKASVAQSKQVTLASESVAAMAASTEEVSGNAERSSDVARHSVDVAHKGGEAVRRTIDGMNAIRETIQETSKRIKRLGESSQEIGNIVELINDIAEQTNILALNASIQASMAGEAGRGFAVVADEVQRLAERSANATRQIEVLVRTIQADTNEAVVSMERSTTDVVGGALLAENAGAALEEIEQVSNQIASLVQNISASAREQASAAQNISRNMGVLREISAQTAENSSATSSSVGKLAELSAQLRRSVAGFRLPDAVTGSTALLTGHGGSTPHAKDDDEAELPAPRKISGLVG
ncbi:chemotaxis protein [Steroidobacter denitrificans]|uniref:Chemotaxis protein n=1 Tax=Steroidobacter denitrificans TaxID=465721 RepID=A0A127F865_STEDE|nr:methyl-accepting chemotaxis protein [Steroidobacter denitrificans]AMN45795.1 chemotaxis protein [Steroidobacter denitrificans]